MSEEGEAIGCIDAIFGGGWCGRDFMGLAIIGVVIFAIIKRKGHK